MAESFGTDAGRYDRARPSYPAALIEAIVLRSPGRQVLDIGCGTGIAARQFQAAGCTVLGIDVDARMAEVARQTGVPAEVAAFETWDPAGRTFDAVTAGQAWHWVDPVAGAAAARALRPGGRLAPFWNVFQPGPELGSAFATVDRQVDPGAPGSFWDRNVLDLYAPGFAKTADGIARAGVFGEPEQWRYEWERHYTRDEWLDQLPTFGGYTRLPPDELAKLLAAAGAAIDAMGGSFTMPYVTVAVTARRCSAGEPAS
jgi:SAM-dependent methyltransferase